MSVTHEPLTFLTRTDDLEKCLLIALLDSAATSSGERFSDVAGLLGHGLTRDACRYVLNFSPRASTLKELRLVATGQTLCLAFLSSSRDNTSLPGQHYNTSIYVLFSLHSTSIRNPDHRLGRTQPEKAASIHHTPNSRNAKSKMREPFTSETVR